jgi:hypothetical protein
MKNKQQRRDMGKKNSTLKQQSFEKTQKKNTKKIGL